MEVILPERAAQRDSAMKGLRLGLAGLAMLIAQLMGYGLDIFLIFGPILMVTAVVWLLYVWIISYQRIEISERGLAFASILGYKFISWGEVDVLIHRYRKQNLKYGGIFTMMSYYHEELYIRSKSGKSILVTSMFGCIAEIAKKVAGVSKMNITVQELHL